MKNTLLAMFMAFFAATAIAQPDLSKVTAAAAENVKPGGLLNQLAGAIDPKVFLKSFDKDKWTKSLDGITTPQSMGLALTQLAGGLSPEAFSGSWDSEKPSWLSQAKGLTSLAAAAPLMKSLEAAIKPEMLNKDWSAQKPAWLDGLSQIK